MNINAVQELLGLYQRMILPQYPPTLSRYEHQEGLIQRFLQLLTDQKTKALSKQHMPAHLTVSAWIMAPSRDRALLCYHPKIRKWIPLGGHTEPQDSDLWQACLREVEEECGLSSSCLCAPSCLHSAPHLSSASTLPPAVSGPAFPPPLSAHSQPLPFDLDIHHIPAHGHQPAHQHYDVRFLILASHDHILPSAEIDTLRWVRDNHISTLTSEHSTLRQHRKAKWLQQHLHTIDNQS